jgi:hypothetical protein
MLQRAVSVVLMSDDKIIDRIIRHYSSLHQTTQDFKIRFKRLLSTNKKTDKTAAQKPLFYLFH